MKRISILFLCMLMMVTCKKDADPVMVKVNYNNVEASASQAVISGSYEYSMEIKSFEILYSEREDMSSSKSVKVYPEGNDFSATLKDLKNGTKYYYQLYFDGEYNSTKLEVMSFTTAAVSVPKVTTNAVTNVIVNSASCGGNVTDDGGAAVTSRGVCWSTNQNPTISGNHTTNGSGTGSFTSNITGLSDNTTYYVRAYATNSAGTSYGEQKSFKTLSADNVEDIDLPTVITNMVSDVTETTAVSGGNVTDDGGGTILARGVCWSTNQNPSINDSHTTNGSGTGIFTSQIIGLLGGKTYYVRAYATNEKGTSYGIQKMFTTLSDGSIDDVELPTLTTNQVTSITQTTAVSGGYVTYHGGGTVSSRGVCWSTSQYPTINGSQSSHTNDGGGTGMFTSNITGLTPNTTYYVRAYATNEKGTNYGEQRSFSTQAEEVNVELPTVTTNNVTDITQTTATSGGNVTDDGGATITARGVCWSTNQNPTISDSHTTDGTGTGSFTSNITGLTADTTYYVRSYATNETGTSYGEEVSFTTAAVFDETIDSNGNRIITLNGVVVFTMIAVEGGTFQMGATSEQGSDAYSNESPVHSVTLSDYYIGETEVTQELWQAVMGSNPSDFSGYPQRPVENVSWNDCQEFITKLNELTGKNFRLPTEAEWEYAARGGNKSKGYKYSGSNNIDDIAWYGDNSSSRTHDVKTKQANELGIYDMSGNVWEWCQDWYGDYSSSSQTNPTGPSSGSTRVLRGGSWYSRASGCRVSKRNSYIPGDRSNFDGFRLVLQELQ